MIHRYRVIAILIANYGAFIPDTSLSCTNKSFFDCNEYNTMFGSDMMYYVCVRVYATCTCNNPLNRDKMS